MDSKDKIKELQDKIAAYQREISTIESVGEEISDLEISRDRWDHEYYTSKSANSKVTGAWFNHNCGCCADSPLQMWPYLETGDRRIHSSPKYFTIGEKCPNCCDDKPYDGWEEELRQAGIPESVIEIGRQYFKENECNGRCWDDDDDEED